jgi:hypothetical protein
MYNLSCEMLTSPPVAAIAFTATVPSTLCHGSCAISSLLPIATTSHLSYQSSVEPLPVNHHKH